MAATSQFPYYINFSPWNQAGADPSITNEGPSSYMTGWQNVQMAPQQSTSLSSVGIPSGGVSNTNSQGAAAPSSATIPTPALTSLDLPTNVPSAAATATPSANVPQVITPPAATQGQASGGQPASLAAAPSATASDPAGGNFQALWNQSHPAPTIESYMTQAGFPMANGTWGTPTPGQSSLNPGGTPSGAAANQGPMVQSPGGAKIPASALPEISAQLSYASKANAASGAYSRALDSYRAATDQSFLEWSKDNPGRTYLAWVRETSGYK